MDHLCDTKMPCNLKICEQTMKKEYAKTWLNLIKRKPKLRTYCSIKLEFKTEAYVKLNLTRSQRSYLAQLRSGTLPLHIETGRFVGKDPTERICQLCDLNEIESEFHFIFLMSAIPRKKK